MSSYILNSPEVRAQRPTRIPSPTSHTISSKHRTDENLQSQRSLPFSSAFSLSPPLARSLRRCTLRRSACCTRRRIQDGQGEGAHQHRGHRPCGLRQVDDDGPPDLQAGRHRQAGDRAVREGGGGDEQAVVQVRVGAGQAEGGARARHHHRHRAVEVRDGEVLLHGDRRARAPRLHQEHDHGDVAGGLRRADHRLDDGRVRGRHLEGRADARARAAGVHAGSEADDLLLQQDGRDDAQVQQGAVRGDHEGGVGVPEEGGVQPGQDPVRADLGVRGRQHDRAVEQPGVVQGADAAGGAGRGVGAEEAVGQAAAAAPAGRVQDRGHRDGAGGARGDGGDQARDAGVLRADGADDGGEVGGDAPRVDAGGAPGRQRGVQREERGGEGPEAGVRGVGLEERPREGGGQLHGAGDHHEPPGADRERVRAGAGLPHVAHRGEVRGDHDEGGQAVGQGAGEGAEVSEERRRRVREDDSDEADDGGDVRGVPAAGAVRGARHEADGGGGSDQGGGEEGRDGREGDEGGGEEEMNGAGGGGGAAWGAGGVLWGGRGCGGFMRGVGVRAAGAAEAELGA